MFVTNTKAYNTSPNHNHLFLHSIPAFIPNTNHISPTHNHCYYILITPVRHFTRGYTQPIQAGNSQPHTSAATHHKYPRLPTGRLHYHVINAYPKYAHFQITQPIQISDVIYPSSHTPDFISFTLSKLSNITQ